MATHIKIQVDSATLKRLVFDYLSSILHCDIAEKDVHIEVKSSQNYKAEWENGDFRAVVDTFKDAG